MVPLTVEEYQRLRGLESQHSALQAQLQADLNTKEAERIKALADKGHVEQAMSEQEKRYQTQLQAEKEARLGVERQYHGEKKSAAMSAALMGVPFVSAVAATQVQSILDSQFETRLDGNGQIMVVDKMTGRQAVEVIKERLASPEFAHFLKPQTQGGSGGGGFQPAPRQPNGDDVFATMDLSQPIGLHARRN